MALKGRKILGVQFGPNLLSIAIISTMAQRNLEEGRICLAYMDHSLSLREPEGRNPSRGRG